MSSWTTSKHTPVQLTDYQSDVFFRAPEQHRIILMPCGRRVGKTAGGLISSVKYLLDRKGPGLWISTNFLNIAKHQSKFLFPLLQRFDPRRYKINNRQLSFGSDITQTLDFASATRPEMIEGHGYRFIMIDESGIVFRRPSSESFYNSTLMPMLMDYEDSKIFLLGTPKGVNNLYHQLYLKAQNKVEGYYSRTVSSYDNPFFSNQQVASAMAELSGPYRRQEVFGEFVSGADSVVSFSDVVRVDERPNNLIKIAMGIDFASSLKDTADFTGIVIAGIDPDNAITILHVEEIKSSFHLILERIKWLADQYHPNVIRSRRYILSGMGGTGTHQNNAPPDSLCQAIEAFG